MELFRADLIAFYSAFQGIGNGDQRSEVGFRIDTGSFDRKRAAEEQTSPSFSRETEEKLARIVAKTELLAALMSREPGVWQHRWAPMDGEVRKALCSHAFGSYLVAWPTGASLGGGRTRRIFGRLQELMFSMDVDEYDPSVFLVPDRWVSGYNLSLIHI